MTRASWPTVHLGEVLRQASDAHRVDAGKDYPNFGIYSFGRGLFRKPPISGTTTSARTLFRVREGQFIYSRLFAFEGAYGVVSSEFDGSYVSNEYPTFEAETAQLIPEYLPLYFRAPAVWELVARGAVGMGDRRRRVQPEQFLRHELPLPPLPEQRRIVAKISELSAKMEEAKALHVGATDEADVLLKAAARSVLATLRSQRTELSDWLDSSREGIQTGPFGAQLSSAAFTDSGTPVLTIGNVQYRGLDTTVLRFVSAETALQLQRYKIAEGDILFARMGTVGRCCVVPPEAAGWLINYHIIRVALDKMRVHPRFVHWTIQASAEVERYLDAKIRGATRQGVNSQIVAALPCRIPDSPAQQRIVAHLDTLQARLSLLKRDQSVCTAELDALLPAVFDRAFRGEL